KYNPGFQIYHYDEDFYERFTEIRLGEDIMNRLNAIRRRLVSYIVLLGILSAMGLMVDISGREVQKAVETLEMKNRQVSSAAL
ncbi:MAG: hypothetical protein QNI97_03880, partial [Desulfobacterales bacterium]|nr:hypothetical protein [Desulfobacterales bacterium]